MLFSCLIRPDTTSSRAAEYPLESLQNSLGDVVWVGFQLLGGPHHDGTVASLDEMGSTSRILCFATWSMHIRQPVSVLHWLLSVALCLCWRGGKLCQLVPVSPEKHAIFCIALSPFSATRVPFFCSTCDLFLPQAITLHFLMWYLLSLRLGSFFWSILR